MKGRALVLGAVPALLLLLTIWPLVTGNATLYLRDVLNTHLFLRAYLARELPHGHVPTIDPLRAGGQPLSGNPNALPWYPDNLLLFLGISPLGQLNLHFWLHWILGTLGIGYLARVRGQSWEGACGAMAAWAFSGYWYSQMNLMNAVAPIALAPWLAAAVVRSAREPRAGRATAAVALVWGLALLGGDPALAGLAAVLATVALREGERVKGWLHRLILAFGLGTVAASCQLLETARVLEGSFRSVWGYGDVSPFHFGPDPRQLLDLVLPLFFGRPDLGVDWLAAGGGPARLYYSLAPGLLFLAIAGAGSGEPKGNFLSPRRSPLVWLGVVGALMAFLWPVGGLLWGAPLPGTNVFRYPVKFLLWTAVPLALAVGRGTERLLRGEGWKRIDLLLAALFGCELALWILLSLATEGWPQELLQRLAPELAASALEAERVRWAGTALLQTAALLAALMVRSLRQRAPLLAVSGFLALASASQALLHRPLVATDERAPYERVPRRLELFPAEAVLCHGASGALFGDSIGYGVTPPDRRLLWVFRRAHERLYSYSAPLFGWRIECAISPEGLDSFLGHFTLLALRGVSDTKRVQVLRSLGVDYLLLERPLAEPDLGVVSVAGPEPDGGGYVYRLEGSLQEVQLLGTVEAAASVDEALRRLMEPSFDPRRVALLPGAFPPQIGPPGTAKLVSSSSERIEIAVDSASGGVLVVRRAFLPIWKARIDDQPAAPVPAQISRLGVRVPPGSHRVIFEIDSRPKWVAVGLSGFALVAMASLVLRRPR